MQYGLYLFLTVVMVIMDTSPVQARGEAVMARLLEEEVGEWGRRVAQQARVCPPRRRITRGLRSAIVHAKNTSAGLTIPFSTRFLGQQHRDVRRHHIRLPGFTGH